MNRAASSARELLRIEDLTVAFGSGRDAVEVLRGVTLAVAPGAAVGLVGESGSGKSLTALAALRLLPPAARMVRGRILFHGEDLVRRSERDVRGVRGTGIGMVPQEPASALDPVFSVGAQLVEVIRALLDLAPAAARNEAVRLLRLVALPDPDHALDTLPHELSGGQRQRVTLALALAGRPRLLIADEPTSALDVSVEMEMLELLTDLRRELGLALLLISHDLASVAETCERVAVMYAGEVVEEGATEEVFARPLHPYTRALLATVPRLGVDGPRGARLPTIPGGVPDPRRRPPGCAFHPRCSEAFAACRSAAPEMLPRDAGRRVRCLLYAAPGEAPRA